MEPEPTTDPEPKSAMSDQLREPALTSTKDHNPNATIVQEHEPKKECDQVCEPVPVSVLGICIKYVVMTRRPAHIPITDC